MIPGMDTVFSDMPDMEHLEHAVVVYANRYQFAPGETITNLSVESRAVVWSPRGAGSVRAGRRELRVPPETVVLLPWRHDIRYVAERADPFLVSAVHVVPWHDPAAAIRPGAAHGGGDALAGIPERADREWQGLSGVRFVTGGPALRLQHLGEAAIAEFADGRVPDSSMRALGVLFVHAALSAARGVASPVALPPALITMQEYIGSHLHAKLPTAEIAAVAGVSAATAERLFRRASGSTVQRWVRTARMTEAARLLRSSNLRVAEVSRRTGYIDPLYFSRVFRRHHGVPPSGFAQGARPL